MPARSICWAATGPATIASTDANVMILMRDEAAAMDPPVLAMLQGREPRLKADPGVE